MAKPKYIRVLLQRRQDLVKAVMKPNYDLKDKKVALILPPKGADYYERIKKYFIMNGTDIVIASTARSVSVNDKSADSPANRGKTILVEVSAENLDISGLHGIIFLSGDGVESYRTNEKLLALVKAANQNKKILGAVGAAAPILIFADEKILEKKITSDKDNAQLMIDKKANYTGNEIESDENIFTTTGFNKETIDGFLAKVKGAVKDFSIKKPDNINTTVPKGKE